MRVLDPAELAAIAARAVVARDFVWLTVRNRATGSPVGIGFWSDGGPREAECLDPITGAVETRTFNGGALASIGDIQLVSDLSVRTVEVVLSGLDPAVSAAVNTHDPRGAPVQILRGYLDPTSRALVAPAKARFVGFVDEAPIVTAGEGEASTVTLRIVSHARELGRKNPDVRSHESQQKRLAGDDFFRDAGVVGEWEFWWGRKTGKAGA